MAIRANVTLTDAATTPVNHVYAPVAMKSDVLFWSDRTVTTVALGQNKLSLLQKSPSKSSKSYKFSWKLEAPTLEQTSASTATGFQPQPTVAYNNLGVVDLVFNERSTLQERKDMMAQIRDLLAEAIVTSQANDLEYIY